ncbi:MAG TPA: T9SS type A sorting domain-containing protein [Bacteroides sp.]|nr:T9SS type A sorting domain-containing protein [Bacteroides sp.]
MRVDPRLYRLIILALFVCGNGTLNAQLQHPGKPFGFEPALKAAAVIYSLPPLDPLELEANRMANDGGDAKVLRFAVERPVDLSPSIHGCWVPEGDMRVWRVHLISPEAISMGLVFNGYNLKEGVKVFVYDPDMLHIRGAFTSGNNKPSGILAVGHIPGQELIVEMQVPNGLSDYGIFRIETISHAFLSTGACGLKRDIRFGRSQACEIDINCEEGDGWQLHKKSVVRIYTTREYCTGVLVNNTSYDGIPYLLTSEHCINRTYYADRSVFVFNYESPECFGGDGSTAMSISGCDTMAVGDSIDFSLVRLSVSPPDSFDVYYAGWDLDNYQPSTTTTIHHPEGDVKKISKDYQPVSIVEKASDIPQGDLRDYYYFSYWWIRQWDEGSTEGGSSGSPLFNAEKRMIGILTGGYASCGDSIGYDEEKDRVIYNTTLNRNDYYTRLNVAWDYYGENGPALKPWLDPLNSGATTIGGYHPASTDTSRLDPDSYYHIYPNPVQDILFIVPRYISAQRSNYRVYDLSGSIFLSGSFGPGEQMSLDVRSLGSGFYLLGIESNGQSVYLKFVVTR